jgi:glyceraldehyde-3-phosphate dehydrogenase (NADP+)
VVTCCRSSNTCDGSSDASTCANSDSLEEDPQFRVETITLGRLPQFATEDTLQVLQVARDAWANGNGVWTQMTLQDRCRALRQFLQELGKRREEMVTTLMFEIGKNRPDAEAEFDRTIDFAKQVITIAESSPEFGGGQWQTLGSTTALVRRAAIGVFLSLAPYNYPLNECYAAIIPCLLLGNVVILKLPTIGGLVHLWTMDAFRKTLPAGAINFIAGPGRTTMPPLMATGKIDGLAFIGGTLSMYYNE